MFCLSHSLRIIDKLFPVQGIKRLIIGVIKHTMGGDQDAHRDWVTCVRFSPNVDDPVIVSSGRDFTVKVWDMNTFELKHNLIGHKSYVNAVTVSPDGSLCASA